MQTTRAFVMQLDSQGRFGWATWAGGRHVLGESSTKEAFVWKMPPPDSDGK